MKSFLAYTIITLRLLGVAGFLCFVYAIQRKTIDELYMISLWVTIGCFVLALALWIIRYFYFEE